MQERRRHWHRLRSTDPADRDYPGTSYWVAAPNWIPRTEDIRSIIIHTTGGPSTDESRCVNKMLGTPAPPLPTLAPNLKRTFYDRVVARPPWIAGRTYLLRRQALLRRSQGYICLNKCV